MNVASCLDVFLCGTDRVTVLDYLLLFGNIPEGHLVARRYVRKECVCGSSHSHDVTLEEGIDRNGDIVQFVDSEH